MDSLFEPHVGLYLAPHLDVSPSTNMSTRDRTPVGLAGNTKPSPSQRRINRSKNEASALASEKARGPSYRNWPWQTMCEAQGALLISAPVLYRPCGPSNPLVASGLLSDIGWSAMMRSAPVTPPLGFYPRDECPTPAERPCHQYFGLLISPGARQKAPSGDSGTPRVAQNTDYGE